jgi:hypothetical protein
MKETPILDTIEEVARAAHKWWRTTLVPWSHRSKRMARYYLFSTIGNRRRKARRSYLIAGSSWPDRRNYPDRRGAFERFVKTKGANIPEWSRNWDNT